MSKKEKIKKICIKCKNATLWIGLVVIIFLVLVGGVAFGFEKYYENKVYPRIYLGEESVGGLTFMELLDKIEEKSEEINTEGLKFEYEDDELTVEPVVVSMENWEQPEVVSEVLRFNDQDLAEELYNLGHGSIYNKLRVLALGEKASLKYQLKDEDLEEVLTEYYSQYETPATEAELFFQGEDLVILSEVKGTVFDYESVIEEVRQNLDDYQNEVVELKLIEDEPELTKKEAEEYKDEITEVLNLAPLKLTYEEKEYEVSEEELKTWLKLNGQGLELIEDEVLEYLEELAEEIDVPVIEGKYSVDEVEGEVVINQFQESQSGLEIKQKKTKENISQGLLSNKNNVIELVVDVAEPKVTPENVQEDIKELLGTGQTNFSGSSYSRIGNISKGADIVNGLLIAPGETFSLIKSLGEIDGAHGWYSELVIKGNETTPEYGGGLCQVGTTTFRAAMMAGLEIVERRNHSYAVSYYNYNGKPGVDATIYDPKPDMRFKNDTGHYILWRSRIEGKDIYFEFWGTSDGRNGYFTEPKNYNYKAPPATIITETDDLAPGERNCTESAHTGLSADFDYIIERSDGTQDIENFSSVYKAWPAVCLVGKEEESVEEPQEEDEGAADLQPVQEEEEEVKEESSKKKKKKKS